MGNVAVDHNPPTASWQGIHVAPVAEAAWSAAHDERSRLHPSTRCPTHNAPYGDKDPWGERLHPQCQTTGCLDLHHELMERMINQVRKSTARAPERTIHRHKAYLSRVATTQLVELSRAARVKLGFPAKPTRDDGAAGRVTRALSEEPRGPWLVILFRILRAYPFTQNHTTAQWPLGGFAEECGKVLGTPLPTAEEIKADINHVLHVARSLLGNAWVHDNIILPLRSHAPTLELFEEYPSESDTTDSLMAWQLTATHRKLLAQGMASEDALRRAFKRIYGVVLREITPAINSAFEDLALLSAMPR